MTSPARNKPRASIKSPGGGLAERDMNPQAPTEVSAVAKGKKRAVQSMGGAMGGALSPKTQARRDAKPRKSILKPIPKSGENDENEEEGQETLVHEASIMVPAADVTMIQGRSRQDIISQAQEQERMEGYTVNFNSSGRPSISSRRVSFAPSAHVRMFETPANTTSRRRSSIAPSASGPAPGAVPGQPNTFTIPPPAPLPVASTSSGPRASNAGHGRRSSINNIAAIGVTDDGEGSMEMSLEQSTDDEEAYSDDGTVPANQAIYNPPAADSEDEGEMSMEMTQNFGGGVIHQQGDESFMTDSSVQSDGEKTMEFTIAIGGVLPTAPPTGAQRGRNSVGYNHLGPAGQAPLVPGEGDEDDMEMDETVAFGGIVSYANPDDTISTTGSDDTINHNHPGREDRTMTFSFGDLQAAARQEQTVEMDMDMDMEMDMTTVGGGIFANTHTYTHTHLHTTIQTSTTPKSPRIQTQPLTRPSGSTPSFARPTASSASKAKTLSSSPEKPKRNIFGPSPSPHRPNTPRKSGMQTAGEVAKRLSFGSASGSVHGSAKRTRPEDVDVDERVQEKRQRLSIAPVSAVAPAGAGLGDSIFGRPQQVKPRQSLGRPQPRHSIQAPPPVPGAVHEGERAQARQSLGRPQPRQSMQAPPPLPEPVYDEEQVEAEVEAQTSPDVVDSPFRPRPSGTPSRSPAVRRAVGFPEPIPTINIEQEDEQEQVIEEPAVIGLSAFLNMIGAHFVDSVPTMGRRKSLGKGVLGTSTRDRTFQACDYTEAKLEAIFLNTYVWATTRIRSEITDCQSELTYNEKSYDQFNPLVITEYLTSPENDRIQFEDYFRNLRIHTDLKAKEEWYDWKMGMMDRVRPDVEEVLNEVLQDEIKLDEMSAEVDDYLPQLRERAALLNAELKKEREIVAELEACNQGELSDWRNTVLDTKKALDEQIAESTEMTTKLGELKAKLGEYESTIRDHTSAISSAKSKCDEWTRSDVGKIQREYETLQDLHQWKIQFLRADRLEMHYASEVRLTFNCSAFVPDLGTASISYLSSNGEGAEATAELLELVKANLGLMLKSRSKITLAQVVQKIGSQWNSVQRFRQELKLVSTQYPTSYTLVPGKSATLKCSTTMLIPSKRGKVVLDFQVGGDVLGNWPAGLLGVGVDVRGVYGDDLDLSILKMAAEEAIAEVREDGYIGVLVNACRDAAQQYL